MNWRNEEHYPDTTAAEAMSRTICPDPDGTVLPDGEGYRLLAEAVARQAVEDYAEALRRLPAPSARRRADEAAGFLRSDFFHRLTGLNGGTILRMIRREMKKE